MQLGILKKGWKPVTLATGLILGSSSGMYADIDTFSNINTIINSKITSNYLSEVNNPVEIFMSNERYFEYNYNEWRRKTMFVSSIQEIINNENFKAIVSMNRNAVPFILNEISKAPSTLVWALNMIYNSKITNNPNATITEACKLWMKALS